MKKVYLSSTFNDLKEYRSAVRDLFILLNNQFPLYSMEYYAASDKPTLAKCQEDASSCDIYILLIANRYGYIPDDPVRNPQNKSITELEFEAATYAKNTVFAFFANQAATDKFPPDDDQDDPRWTAEEKKEKLTAFQKRVTSAKQPSSPFKRPEELAYRVSASIIGWLNERSRPEERMYDKRSKYCCNRSSQFNRYETNRVESDSKFQVFISNGIGADQADNFVNRCAIFSLNLDEQEIINLTFNDFFDEEEGDYGYSLRNFLRQVRLRIPVATETTSGLTIAKVLEEIGQKVKEHLVIRLTCYEASLAEEKIEFLTRLFGELHAGCSTVKFTRHMYFFLNIEDGHENELQKEPDIIHRLKGLLHNKRGTITFLSRFKPIDKDILKAWLNYITADEGQKRDLLKAHFSELPKEFRMEKAEKYIRRLYERIERKDPDIINILKF